MGLLSLLKRTKSAPAVVEPVMRELPAPVETAPPLPAPEIVPERLSPAEVQQQLFAAIVAGDDELLSTLCHEHRDVIRDNAPAWSVVPDGLRANPAAAEWYERGLHLLLGVCQG
jgi:hypothetical protein